MKLASISPAEYFQKALERSSENNNNKYNNNDEEGDASAVKKKKIKSRFADRGVVGGGGNPVPPKHTPPNPKHKSPPEPEAGPNILNLHIYSFLINCVQIWNCTL